MKALDSLFQPAESPLTEEQEEALTNLLAAAYAGDEQAGTDPALQRIAGKVQAYLQAPPS